MGKEKKERAEVRKIRSGFIKGYRDSCAGEAVLRQELTESAWSPIFNYLIMLGIVIWPLLMMEYKNVYVYSVLVRFFHFWFFMVALSILLFFINPDFILLFRTQWEAQGRSSNEILPIINSFYRQRYLILTIYLSILLGIFNKGNWFMLRDKVQHK